MTICRKQCLKAISKPPFDRPELLILNGLKWVLKPTLAMGLMLLAVGGVGRAQSPDAPPPGQDQEAPTGRGQRRGPEDGRGQPLFGKITAISNGTVQLTKPDGTTAIVKITDKTELRKDRQNAKLEDFKVGDTVFVRGEENADHSVTAAMIGARTGGGPQGGGRGQGGGAALGELGKDFVVGEVKSVDAPKLTVLRPDNATQTLELNEDTSLRKGRDSITMADIQPGDHVVVRGGVQNNTFVPKNVMVLSPEQWKRMQEMGTNGRGDGGNAPAGNAPSGSAPPADPKGNPPQL
jgi:hypothetical protein